MALSLCRVSRFAYCYTEFRYTECRYAKCRGANKTYDIIKHKNNSYKQHNLNGKTIKNVNKKIKI